MLARVLSAALLGVEAALVRVEVDVSPGLPAFMTVGLPDSAVRESRERVRTAIRNAGFPFPQDRITVNLAPADVRKEGASFDLPIALGILAATGCLEEGRGRLLRRGRRAGPGRPDPAGAGHARRRARLPAARHRHAARSRAPTAPRRRPSTASRIIPAGTLGDAVAMLNGEAAVPAPSGARISGRSSGCPRTISATWWARPTPSAPWRSPPPAATTSSSWVRPARARRCSPDGWARSFRP